MLLSNLLTSVLHEACIIVLVQHTAHCVHCFDQLYSSFALMNASADCVKTLTYNICSACPMCCQSYRHMKPFEVCHASSHVDFGGIRLPNPHVCMLKLFTMARQPFQEHMCACSHCSLRLHSNFRSAYCLLKLDSTFGAGLPREGT